MWAATPRLIDFSEDSSLGPIVTAPQPGIEHRHPALSCRVLIVLALKSSLLLLAITRFRCLFFNYFTQALMAESIFMN
ncbi:hypothetical protein vBYenM3117_002 [Yersinia phage vB_YenM_31.17]|uniref:hypothetical protein n=1 Tax=Yersinia phage vB_YenM_31.17 TaxID=2914028 RepID=UPI0023290A77|nr:hypothetical protein PQA70_gp02 [Yersinia phage vB_YenM_31.17]UKL54228.1 hypothetical protein vBYenM3117_002 [Yersinia phage vB_YenM_31.17]